MCPSSFESTQRKPARFFLVFLFLIVALTGSSLFPGVLGLSHVPRFGGVTISGDFACGGVLLSRLRGTELELRVLGSVTNFATAIAVEQSYGGVY